MSNEELNQMIRISKKRYMMDMKQKEIAESESISTSSVSRILNRARELGYIKVSLNFPSLRDEELGRIIKNKFNLKYVHVAISDSEEENIRMSNVSDAFNQYLNNILESNSVLGVSWGETMTYISNNLTPSKKENIKIVQLNGGISNGNISTLSENILMNFARNYNGKWYSLNAPSFVDNSEIAEAIKSDSSIINTFKLIDKTETIIFSVGVVSTDSILLKAGYFNKEEYSKLKELEYVGDICSRYFKADGSYNIDGELYNRVIGISLEEIKSKENSICIAVGEEKAEAILAALKAGYANTLFTDDITAQKIIELLKEET